MKDLLTLKLPARKLCISKRFMALTAREHIKARDLSDDLKSLQQLSKSIKFSPYHEKKVKMMSVLLISELLDTIFIPDIAVQCDPSRHRTIESFSESQCWNFFETRKADLPRLLRVLRLPDQCALENRSSMTGEEVLLQVNSIFQLTIYGDSIYPRLSHLHSSWRHAGATQDQKRENKAYTKVRIMIEWNYGITGSIYSYLRNHDKLRLLASNIVSKVYTVATILRNCHVCMYGCETSMYFGLTFEDDFLERYMQFL